MTSTEDLSKTFPANTAAQRIDASARALTAGFRYRLLDLANGMSEEDSALRILAHTDAIWGALHDLKMALRAAASLLKGVGVQVEGRDLTEEDRALARVLSDLHGLSRELQGSEPLSGDQYDIGVAAAEGSAGERLGELLRSQDVLRSQAQG